jgi:hypothetical protein
MTSAGNRVPLSAVARYEFTNTPLSVNHQGQFAASTISFNLPETVSLSQAGTLINETMARIGVPASVYGSFQGTARSFQTTMAKQPWLILAAILAMYIVLGVLYESVVHPLTILSTLPSAGVGALLALMAFGAEFTVIALIGVFLLIGLVKKNAIMMVDFALAAERDRHLRPEQAILEACLLRFRPIMMTTMAALLGALPLVLRQRRRRGAAPAARHRHRRRPDPQPAPHPLYDAVVYLYLDRFRLWLRRRRPSSRPHETLSIICVLRWPVRRRADYKRPEASFFRLSRNCRLDRARPQDDLPRGQWWSVFEDAELDALLQKVDVSNQNVRAAEARLRQARALYDQARAGSTRGERQASVCAARRRRSPTIRPSPTGAVNTFNANVGATWELDLWARCAARSRRATRPSRRAPPSGGGELSARAALAQAYFSLRVTDATRQLLAEHGGRVPEELRADQNRYKAGVAARVEVVAAEYS